MASIQNDIRTYKEQISSFLNKEYLDQSLLLGFNNVIQSKFHSWITSDFASYHQAVENSDVLNNQLNVEFKTILFFETIWSDFHYPIIKYFKYHYAGHFSDVLTRYQHNSADFKLNPVQMRKLHENFTKFIKQVQAFYTNLMKYFATHYHNSLLPNKFLADYDLEVSKSAVETVDSNVQANILYLIHKCLIALGDLSRHRTSLELTYVTPCSSKGEFFKARSLSNKDKAVQYKPHYDRALKYYHSCILLLPALNEPYNHLGMIHSIIDDKYNACLWFLRSQFTRLPDFTLGQQNLATTISKNWFLTNFVDFTLPDKDSKKRQKFSYSKAEELDITLICLIGYFYLPKVYKHGPNFVKKIPFSKVESQFFKTIEESFEKLIVIEEEDGNTFFLKQLTILFSFNSLIQKVTGPDANELISKFSKFTFRYVDKVLESIAKSSVKSPKILTNSLIILRLILSWIKENKVVFRTFLLRKSSVSCLSNIMNVLIGHTQQWERSQHESIVELIEHNTRPVRSYYFQEDVLFKDYSLITFQFKDFKDEHLFRANNLNLLIGDYSSYNDANGIPSFLNNEVVARIDEKLSSQPDGDLAKIVTLEIRHYETNLRIQSCIALGKKLLTNNNFGIEFDLASQTFSVKDRQGTPETNMVEIDDSQGKNSTSSRKRKTKKSRSTTPQTEDTDGKIDVENTVDEIKTDDAQRVVPASLEEIESVILNHSSQLHAKLVAEEINSSSELHVTEEDSQREEGYKTMVDVLVDDTELHNKTNASPSTREINPTSPNFWNQNKVVSSTQETQPGNDAFKIPFIQQHTQPAHPVTYPIYPGAPPPPPPSQFFGHFAPQPYPQYSQYMTPMSSFPPNAVDAGNGPYYMPPGPAMGQAPPMVGTNPGSIPPPPPSLMNKGVPPGYIPYYGTQPGLNNRHEDAYQNQSYPQYRN